MEQTSLKRNFVFISYNHKDVKWAQWLQKKLEWYRLPTEMRHTFPELKYIRPVFRDRDTLTSGVLNDELRHHLEASEYLVVLCSPNSAQSEWVSDEVKTFIEMGRLNKIVPFIVEGTPQNYSHADVRQALMGECFPLALRQWNTEHPEQSLLGIAVTDDGNTDRQKAFIRLVAHLLGVEFDVLWQRHKRYLRRLALTLLLSAIVALALIYWFMIPIRLNITIKDQISHLPSMEQGVLNVNSSEYIITAPDTTIAIGSLPGYYRLRKVRVNFHADRFYVDTEESILVGMSFNQHYTMQIHRDSTFAIFAGVVYDGDTDHFETHPIADATVTIGQRQTTTNANGQFCIVFPLGEQEETKPITISTEDFQTYQRQDESPNTKLTYLLHKEN